MPTNSTDSIQDGLNKFKLASLILDRLDNLLQEKETAREQMEVASRAYTAVGSIYDSIARDF